jgi:hypothetical protein
MSNNRSEDESYLASSEINFFLRHLFSQVVALRPEDSIDFAAKYFKRIQSCHHVLGADYAYIGATKSNRRAFIFCLMEVFQTYSHDKAISVSEYQQIVDMISPDFPRKIISDAAMSIEPLRGGSNASTVNIANSGGPSAGHQPANKAAESAPQYAHGKLRIALYFHIIYEEWLKYIETIFREEGSLDCLSLFRLRAYLDDCRRNWSISFSQPPSTGVDAALSQISGSEVSFVGLLRALFASEIVQEDVTTIPAKAVILLPPESDKSKKEKKSKNIPDLRPPIEA